MEKKALEVLILVCILLVGSNLMLIKCTHEARQDKQRLLKDYQAANTTLYYYKTKNGELAAKSNVLQLKYNEAVQVYPKILDEIKNLDIKPRLVTNYSETVVKQEKQIIARVKDSVILDTVKIRTFTYHDRFYDVQGKERNDTLNLQINSKDSIIQVIYKGKRYKPWAWIFSKRRLEQVITSKNPSNHIIYNQTINITKK